MIAEIINKWEQNKDKLETYFKTTPQKDYSSYESILKKIFEIVVNTNENDRENYSIDKMTVIDHGEYQGTLIFIVPKNKYQPDVNDYIYTDTYYGSCSDCDTLESIHHYNYELPSEKQVKEYMILALHLVQKMKILQD